MAVCVAVCVAEGVQEGKMKGRKEGWGQERVGRKSGGKEGRINEFFKQRTPSSSFSDQKNTCC